jgi:hypothetical protein
MFLGVATRPTEDGPPFNCEMEAGRWEREAKTAASDRAQVSGCKAQGLTTTWERQDVIVAVNRKSNIGNRERL